MIQLLSAVRRVVRGGTQVVAEHATRRAAVTGHGYDHVGKPVVGWNGPSVPLRARSISQAVPATSAS